MTYLIYICLFFILYRLVKLGFIEFMRDFAICGAYLIAATIRFYYFLKRWKSKD